MLQIEQVPISDLKPYERNARLHSDQQVLQIARSIEEFGFVNPVLVDDDLNVIAGHGRIADNRLALDATWDDELLAAELAAIRAADEVPLDLLGLSADELTALLDPVTDEEFVPPASIATDFLEPPLTVLNMRSGRRRDRKQMWFSRLPIDYSSFGRDKGLVYRSETRNDPEFYRQKKAVEARLGRPMTTAEFLASYYRPPKTRVGAGTSMFCPVLSELMTSWFCPQGGDVLDPFAGDVERGVIASTLGRRYYGVDVRPEQCQANAEIARLAGAVDPVPFWQPGDSRTALDALYEGQDFDLVFTCPPYWCLERYSDDPADLSNMTLAEFNRAHSEIITACVERLRPDRFAIWVIGDVRQPQTLDWARLPARTIESFELAGCTYRNEMILVSPIGNRGAMCKNPFDRRRTITMAHEKVLVFCKGDPARAAAAIGEVEILEPEQDDDAS